MDNLTLLIASGLALLLMLAFAFVAACKTVNKEPVMCQSQKKNEDDVHLDDICEKYLRLTNLD